MTDRNLISVIVAVAALAISMSASAQIHVDPAGNVGIGTTSPSNSLHVRKTDGTAQLRVEEASETTAIRALAWFKNNGGGLFGMENTDTGESWVLVHENNFPNDFLISNSDHGTLFRLDHAGNVTINGSIITAGGTCGSGCDLVFAQDSGIESIDEHASQMWANSYLPSVGPTIENEPINLSEKTGRMLNELEKAHIYIEQLHKRLELLENEQVLAKRNAKLEMTIVKLQSDNLTLATQQQEQYAELKAMLVDLQMQSQSRNLLTRLD